MLEVKQAGALHLKANETTDINPAILVFTMAKWVWRLNCLLFHPQSSHKQELQHTDSSRCKNSQRPCAVILTDKQKTWAFRALHLVFRLQDSSCTVIITKSLLDQKQSVADGCIRYRGESRKAQDSSMKLEQVQNYSWTKQLCHLSPNSKHKDLEEQESINDLAA